MKKKYNLIKKAKHYNNHPSGIECIEIKELLTSNLGSAFKYVFRCEDKDSLIIDLKKAKYYIEREYQRKNDKLNIIFTKEMIKKIDKLLKFESFKLKMEIFKGIILMSELHSKTISFKITYEKTIDSLNCFIQKNTK